MIFDTHAKTLAVAALTLGLSLPCFSAPVSPEATSLLRTKRILLLNSTASGDHGAARNAVADVINEWKGVVPFTLTASSQYSSLNTTFLNNFDIIILSYADYVDEKWTQAQKDAFKAFIESGKGFIGLHTSGATRETVWPWYRNSVTSMLYRLPYPGLQTSTVKKTTDAAVLSNKVLKGMADSWSATDEWYVFEQGASWKDVKVLYSVDQTTIKYNTAEPMPDGHPVAWIREDPATKARFFYSSLIHSASFVKTDFYRSLILRSMEWVSGYDTVSTVIGVSQASTAANPAGFSAASAQVSVQIAEAGFHRVVLRTTSGKLIATRSGQGPHSYTLPVGSRTGVYVATVVTPKRTTSKILAVQ